MEVLVEERHRDVIENSFSPSTVFAEYLLCARNCARLHSITMERDQDRLMDLL